MYCIDIVWIIPLWRLFYYIKAFQFENVTMYTYMQKLCFILIQIMLIYWLIWF